VLSAQVLAGGLVMIIVQTVEKFLVLVGYLQAADTIFSIFIFK